MKTVELGMSLKTQSYPEEEMIFIKDLITEIEIRMIELKRRGVIIYPLNEDYGRFE